MASYDYGKIEIVNYIYQNFAPGNSCLDVGACDGKWAGLLGHYLTMDAVEIFAPNITEHNLEWKYKSCGADGAHGARWISEWY